MRRFLATIVVAFLAIIGLAAPSWAETTVPAPPEPFVLSADGECGQTVVSANVEKGTLVVEAQGEVQNSPVSGSITVGPFVGEVDVHYRVFGHGERAWDHPKWNEYINDGSDEADAWHEEIEQYIADNGDAWLLAGTADPNPYVTWNTTTITGCTVANPEPDKTTTTQDTCLAGPDGTIVLPETEGVEYTTDQTENLFAGEYEVTATPEKGFVFEGEQEVEFTVTVGAEDCTGPPGPQGPPGESDEPTTDPTTEPTTEPVDVEEGDEEEEEVPVPTVINAGSTDTLPKTGGDRDITLPLVVGVVLLALGITSRLVRTRFNL